MYKRDKARKGGRKRLACLTLALLLCLTGCGGNNVVNLSRKSANYKFTRMKKPFVIP